MRAQYIRTLRLSDLTFILTPVVEVGTIVTTIMVKMLNFREIKFFAGDPAANTQQSWDLNPGPYDTIICFQLS